MRPVPILVSAAVAALLAVSLAAGVCSADAGVPEPGFVDRYGGMIAVVLLGAVVAMYFYIARKSDDDVPSEGSIRRFDRESFCPECGREADTDEEFCPECGHIFRKLL